MSLSKRGFVLSLVLIFTVGLVSVLLGACAPAATGKSKALVEIWGMQGDLSVYAYVAHENIMPDLEVLTDNDRGTQTARFVLPLGRYQITLSDIELAKGEIFDPQVFGAHIGLSIVGQTIGFNPQIFLSGEPKSFCAPNENLLQNPLNMIRVLSFLNGQNNKERMEDGEALDLISDLVKRSSKTGLLCQDSGDYQDISWQVVKNTGNELVVDVSFGR